MKKQTTPDFEAQAAPAFKTQPQPTFTTQGQSEFHPQNPPRPHASVYVDGKLIGTVKKTEIQGR